LESDKLLLTTKLKQAQEEKKALSVSLEESELTVARVKERKAKYKAMADGRPPATKDGMAAALLKAKSAKKKQGKRRKGRGGTKGKRRKLHE
jgi:hypothetical protein